MVAIKYLSQQASDYLYDSIKNNLDLYKNGDFQELADGVGKSIDLSVNADLSPLKGLVAKNDTESEIQNSMLVWNALNMLNPSLACENRLWSRLSHVECLEYARGRWLNVDENDDDKIVQDISTHFFANTLTKYRDDNAIARLWWNAYIAKLASPDNQEEALRIILKRADIRSNFIERSRTVSRAPIASGVVRIMLSNSWLTDHEINYREFMKELNKLGGGKVFELWDDQRVDEFMDICFSSAKNNIDNKKTMS